jgi:hemerythrin-like domain-containing protein
MNSDSMDAVELLKDDHEKIQDLFDDFEDTQDTDARRQICEKVHNMLTLHSRIEEDIFYPAVRAELGDDDLVDEAEEEHHVAKMVLSELENMPAGDERYAAKFTVLVESVRHHIREEESEMFPQARKSNLDLEELGEQMAALKQELIKEMGTMPHRSEHSRLDVTRRRGDL